MAEKTMRDSGRNWATIVYPESAKENWQFLLKDRCIPALVSPIHDKDVTEEGEPKKAHYHVLLAFKGKKTRESVKPLVEALGGVGLERVSDLHAYARYLCHLDEWDKPHYSPYDVQEFGGMRYKKYESAKQDLQDSIVDVIMLINSTGMTTYRQMMDFCANERPDLLGVVFKNAYAVQAYLKPERVE